MALSDERFRQALDWLLAQVQAGTVVDELCEAFPEAEPADGWRLQRAWIERRLAAGERLIGMKVALTNTAMQGLFGVDEPCAGHLTSAAEAPPGPLSVGGWVRVNVEPEIGFVLARPLRGPGVTVADVRAATGSVRPAIEVGHLRAGRGTRSLATMLACNTYNGAVVLGETELDPAALDLAAETVEAVVDGEVVARGSGAEVMGDPWAPVAWLANALADDGRGLEPGMVVISGSMLPSPIVRPGQRVEARYAHLGTIAIDFIE